MYTGAQGELPQEAGEAGSRAGRREEGRLSAYHTVGLLNTH